MERISLYIHHWLYAACQGHELTETNGDDIAHRISSITCRGNLRIKYSHLFPWGKLEVPKENDLTRRAAYG